MDQFRHRTLFEETSTATQGVSGSLISVGFHISTLAVIVFGLRHTPRIADAPPARHPTVRMMNLRQAVAEAHTAVGADDYKPNSSADHSATPDSTPAPPPPVLFVPRIHGTQTLIQPDAPPDVILPPSTPVPFVMVWAAQVTPVKPTVSTTPQQVLVANNHPTQDVPNKEVAPAEIKIAATPFHTEAPLPAPATTSPIAVAKVETPPPAPLTVSNAIGQPLPARVMSISDLELKDGTVAIPLANSAMRTPPTDSTSLLREKSSTFPTSEATGKASAPKPTQANGTSSAAADKADQPAKSESVAKSVNAEKGAPGPKPQPGTGSSNTTPSPGPAVSRVDERSITRVHHPKDGQFGVVVVGSALSEEYPEAKELWGGRLVYTVYLHVGTGKNWILQYSLPRSVDAASSGTSVRPEPPWPYELARPAPKEDDLDSDTLMIHGFVTLEVRLEKTAVVFPSGFPNSKLLLDVLDLWQFRPAHQNGQPTVVEVLLIIPAEGA